MAKKKRVKTILISSQKGLDFLQPIISSVLAEFEPIQLEFYNQFSRTIVSNSRRRDFTSIINSSDLILADLTHASNAAYFDIGIARAIGKPIIFFAEEVFVDELPDFIRQSYFIIYHSREELENQLRVFINEYLENPKRFTPRSIIDADSNTQILVDLNKLGLRDFENLCFELLSRLGYKHLEWRVKDEFVDAVTTLRKQDPDGFEYDEFWLIAFQKDFMENEWINMAIHDPEYFAERMYRNIINSEIDRAPIKYTRDIPIILLLILREKGDAKRLLKQFSRKEFMLNKRGMPFSIRIRWWDEETVSTMVQNNLPLARKYFSQDALTRSGVRLSYEELYRQYADTNEQLSTVNQQLISERTKIEKLERDAAWKLLSFTAAHRLGNPMDAIDSELSNLKLALQLGKTEMFGDIISSMEIPVERAKSIVSEFRNLSVAQEIKPEIVDFERIQGMLKYSAKQAIDKNIQVIFDFKPIMPVAIDIKKLSDCFSELVRNSMHFVSGDNKQIAIATDSAKKSELPDKIDRTADYIKITFSDNGSGIPFDRKKDIFKPFERSYVHGTGLGLAFCDSVMEAHGGKIREIGKPGEGAIFEIFLKVNRGKIQN